MGYLREVLIDLVRNQWTNRRKKRRRKRGKSNWAGKTNLHFVKKENAGFEPGIFFLTVGKKEKGQKNSPLLRVEPMISWLEVFTLPLSYKDASHNKEQTL